MPCPTRKVVIAVVCIVVRLSISLDIGCGYDHTCVVEDGKVKCWGSSSNGCLGRKVIYNSSCEEGPPYMLPVVDLGAGRMAKAVSAGSASTCALLTDGSAKCWGRNSNGELGQGRTDHVGRLNMTMGDYLPAIDLGGLATQIATGGSFSCALLLNGSVKCWGSNVHGQLGQGNNATIGDNVSEMGDFLPAIDLGISADGKSLASKLIAVGFEHACALLNDSSVKCWGRNIEGQLGQQNDYEDIGDSANELGDMLPNIDLGLGKRAKSLSAARSHTCALLNDSSVKCWGRNDAGQLGQEKSANVVGIFKPMGDHLPPVDLGAGIKAEQVFANTKLSCAVLLDGSVKCWGRGLFGQLGQGSTKDIGKSVDTMGDNLPSIDLGVGKHASRLALGQAHVCAVLNDSSLKCWGSGEFCQTGKAMNKDNAGVAAQQMGDYLPPIELGLLATSVQTTIATTTTSRATTSSTIAATTTDDTLWSLALRGTLTIEVSNASAFVKEPLVVYALQLTLAETFEVNASWVRNVTVTLADTRQTRLLSRENELTSRLGDEVIVDFAIVTPAEGGPDYVLAIVLFDRFAGKGASEVMKILLTQLEQANLGDYEVEIVFMDVTNERPEPPTLRPQVYRGSKNLEIVIIAFAFLVLVLIAMLLCYLKWLHSKHRGVAIGYAESQAKFLETSTRKDIFSIAELLSPPDAISEEQSDQLQRLLSEIMYNNTTGEVDVFISYDAGRRDQDCESIGIGPGLFYATALLKALYLQSINCVLSVPCLVDRSAVLSMMKEQGSSRKLMLVVETCKLFHSRECLTEVYTAQEHGFEFMRLRFETDLPDAKSCWPEISDNDADGVNMVRALESGYFLLPTYPEPPMTILLDPCTLGSLAMDLKLKSDLARSEPQCADSIGIQPFLLNAGADDPARLKTHPNYSGGCSDIQSTGAEHVARLDAYYSSSPNYSSGKSDNRFFLRKGSDDLYKSEGTPKSFYETPKSAYEKQDRRASSQSGGETRGSSGTESSMNLSEFGELEDIESGRTKKVAFSASSRFLQVKRDAQIEPGTSSLTLPDICIRSSIDHQANIGEPSTKAVTSKVDKRRPSSRNLGKARAGVSSVTLGRTSVAKSDESLESPASRSSRTPQSLESPASRSSRTPQKKRRGAAKLLGEKIAPNVTNLEAPGSSRQANSEVSSAKPRNSESLAANTPNLKRSGSK